MIFFSVFIFTIEEINGWTYVTLIKDKLLHFNEK